MGEVLFIATKTAFVTTLSVTFSWRILANLGSFPGKESLPSIDGHKTHNSQGGLGGEQG